MRRTYKFRLYPTKEQKKTLINVLNLCQKLYNACLYQRKLSWKIYKKGISRRYQQDQLIELKTGINEYNSVFTQVLYEVVFKVDKSFQNFFRRVKKGEKPGYPRFKSYWRYDSFTYPQAGFKLNEKQLHLSKIGDINIILHREIPADAIIKTLTIKRDNVGDWYACFSVVLPDTPKIVINTEKVVGIDVGISNLVTLSSGEYLDNSTNLRKYKRKLKLVDRRLSRKKKGSQNRKKARHIRAKVYRKLKRIEEDNLHKVSLNIVKNYDVVGFEKLNIKGMVKNHYLARVINYARWNTLIQYTTYKAEDAGKTVVLVNPKNTTQECSSCGNIVKKSLAVRIHNCPVCRLYIDRDLNASINIRNRTLEKLGMECPEVTPMEIGVQLQHIVTQPIVEVGSHFLNHEVR